MKQFTLVISLAAALASLVALNGCSHFDELKNSVQLKELSPVDAAELAQTQFDSGAPVTVRGRVSTLFFGPPGSTGMMIIHASDGRYAFSTDQTKTLASQGFHRFSMNPGEEVTVTGALAQGGKKIKGFIAARADSIWKADGEKVFDRAD
jgi:hypothetical protein